MKKVLFGCFCLIFPFVTFLVVLELFFPEEKFSLHEKKAQAFESISELDVLILGNSHATEGIIPAKISAHALNLAHPSQTLPYDLELLRHTLKSGKKPKTVILCLSRFNMFNKPVESTAGKWICYRYHRSYGISYPDWKLYLECRSWSAFFCYRRFYGIKDWMTGGNQIPTIDSQAGLSVFDGWDLSFARLPKEIRDEQAEARASTHWASMSYEELGKNTASLISIIKEAKAANVQPIIITLPLSKSYVSAKTTGLYYERAGQAIADVTSEQGVVWHDFQDDHWDESMFRNSDHLNHRGAVMASEKIRGIVEDIVLKK